jgi:hypothetical protein
VGAQKAESRHRRHERNTREARKDRRIIECLEKQWRRGGSHQQLGRSSIASIAHPFGTYFLSCLTPAAVIRRGSQAPSKDVLHCESANKSSSRAPNQSLDAQELTPDQPLGACSSVSHRGTFCRIRSASKHLKHRSFDDRRKRTPYRNPHAPKRWPCDGSVKSLRVPARLCMLIPRTAASAMPHRRPSHASPTAQPRNINASPDDEAGMSSMFTCSGSS